VNEYWVIAGYRREAEYWVQQHLRPRHQKYRILVNDRAIRGLSWGPDVVVVFVGDEISLDMYRHLRIAAMPSLPRARY